MARITLTDLSFDIPILDAQRSFRSVLLNRYAGGQIRRSGPKKRVIVRALEGISLTLQDGDRVGLVGHNGAGKSTLLRMLAGIYAPSTGFIHREGKVTPLLNPHIGIDDDDTGYQNTVNMAKFLGMDVVDVRNRMDEIKEVSELGDYLALPVRTYSAGMVVRLAVAVLTCLEPEILLLDEGIGAADARFNQRADARMSTLYSKLKILVIATHSEALLRRFCTKAVLLERGRLVAFDEVNAVLDLYRQRQSDPA